MWTTGFSRFWHTAIFKKTQQKTIVFDFSTIQSDRFLMFNGSTLGMSGIFWEKTTCFFPISRLADLGKILRILSLMFGCGMRGKNPLCVTWWSSSGVRSNLQGNPFEVQRITCRVCEKKHGKNHGKPKFDDSSSFPHDTSINIICNLGHEPFQCSQNQPNLI